MDNENKDLDELLERAKEDSNLEEKQEEINENNDDNLYNNLKKQIISLRK